MGVNFLAREATLRGYGGYDAVYIMLPLALCDYLAVCCGPKKFQGGALISRSKKLWGQILS